jgi:hypothetical protein
MGIDPNSSVSKVEIKNDSMTEKERSRFFKEINEISSGSKTFNEMIKFHG